MGRKKNKQTAICHPDRPHRSRGLCDSCYNKAYYAEKKQDPEWVEKSREYGREWRADARKNDPEFKSRDLETRRRWSKNHPEFERARSARRRKENPEYIKAVLKKSNQKHKDKRRERRKQWRKNNPEKYLPQMRADVKKRKARKKGAKISDFTAKQWTEMKECYHNCCFYCGNQPEQLEMEHMIPLSKGGDHTSSNIVPACQRCNLLKGTKTFWEFLSAI